MVKATAIVVTALALSACAVTTKATGIGYDLKSITADEIHTVFPWSFDFQLNREDESQASFAFYGEGADDFVKVECAPAAVFSIVSTSGIKGSMSIAVCSEPRERIERLIANALPRMNETIEALEKVGAKVDEATREERGWEYAKVALPDGSELHYFPILLVGHGVLTAPTAVLLHGEQAVVIQAGTAGLCSYRGRDPELCTDTKNGLFKLLRRIHAKE